MEQDGKWHCEYDKDGNLTERYIGTGRWLDGKKEHWKYRWNADGSLAKVVRPDGEEVTFEYDALGRRLSKSFGTTVTRWMWNGNVPLHQWKQRRSYSREENAWLAEEERKERTLWLFEEESFVPAAMIKEGKAYSILTDHLGTPTEAYDVEGNEVWSRTLDMNGEVIEENGNVGMIPFLFQGQYYDREIELAYNRFRYYSPQMGMYVSQDPIRLYAGTINIYEYPKDTNSLFDIWGLSAYKKDETGSYSIVGGHHVHAKAAFKHDKKYSQFKAFCIGQEYMKKHKLDHRAMTRKQKELFKELALSGRPNTMREHNRIAVETLIAGGATRKDARHLVAQSLINLRKQGVTTPTNIPWY